MTEYCCVHITCVWLFVMAIDLPEGTDWSWYRYITVLLEVFLLILLSVPLPTMLLLNACLGWGWREGRGADI